MPEREIEPYKILNEDLLPASDIDQPLDDTDSESEAADPLVICDCKRLTISYEDLFDQ